MKIKITQPGWAGYTGALGYVEFVDGVSVEDVSTADARHVAAQLSVEEVGTGVNPSEAQSMIVDRGTPAPMETTVLASDVVAAPVVATLYTKEQLEVIADASGIKGIRVITDAIGIKGNAISDLIEKILQAQAAAAAPAEAPAFVAE